MIMNVAAIGLFEALLFTGFFAHEWGYAEPFMIIGFSMIMLEMLFIAYIMMAALYVFYQVALSLEPHFSLNLWPMIAIASALLVWTLGGIIEEASLIKYFSDLMSYENVRSIVIINEIDYLLNAVQFSVLALLLISITSGPNRNPFARQDISFLVYVDTQ